MILKIIRLEKTDNETLGVLFINGAMFCYTLELPYKNNIKNISCIPTGRYSCIKYLSPKTGYTVKLLNVLNRTGIVFHAGNTCKDTLGCIILGQTTSKQGVFRSLLKSKHTIELFMEKISDSEEDISLTIK